MNDTFKIGYLVECISVFISSGASKLGERFIITSIENSGIVVWLGFKFDRFNGNEIEKELIRSGTYPYWNSINFKVISTAKSAEILYGGNNE